MVRWILPSALERTSSHARISHMHRVKQLLGVSEKDQTLLPLHHPCSPIMLLAGHSCCGKGRVGLQSRSCCSVQREHGGYTLYPPSIPPCTMRGTETQHEEAQKEHLLSVLPELDGFGCFTRSGFSAAAPGSSGEAAVWHFSPALMRVAARCGCCRWVGGTAASLQRLKTHFQQAAGAGVGISLPWHGCKASSAAACWGSCG